MELVCNGEMGVGNSSHGPARLMCARVNKKAVSDKVEGEDSLLGLSFVLHYCLVACM